MKPGEIKIPQSRADELITKLAGYKARATELVEILERDKQPHQKLKYLRNKPKT